MTDSIYFFLSSNVMYTYTHVGNLNLYRLKNGRELTTRAAANWTRNELAKALRSGPYQVNGLFAGFDEQNGPELFFLDYLATMHKVNSSGHGYGGMFSLSLFDKHWVPNMSKQQSLQLVRKCVAEIQERLVVAPEKFLVKFVGKDGIEQLTMITATGEIENNTVLGITGGKEVQMET
jgi:20S proteasome subunit beta 4